MEEFLAALIELILEVLLEFAGEAIVDLGTRALGNLFGWSEFASPVSAYAGYAILGGSAGGLSVLIFPHPLIHPSRFHGISLIITPALTGAIMALIGAILRRYSKKTVRIESFWYGFAFAFGFAVLRFVLAR